VDDFGRPPRQLFGASALGFVRGFDRVFGGAAIDDVVGVDLAELLGIFDGFVDGVGLIGWDRFVVVVESPHARLVLRVGAFVTVRWIGGLGFGWFF
jgi:hypothetical protein